MKTIAFIDASNIIYGTRDEGWKVDFKKLFKYLSERYECNTIYYFGGIDEHNYKQEKFYEILRSIGYNLILRKVKIFKQQSGSTIRKANCDVDLTFYAMKVQNKFEQMILLSGDGDFDILVKYFLDEGKRVIVIANARRTAKELKTLNGIQFNDMRVLKSVIEKVKK